jgi:C4-dicarboxylate-specific signal transduction histidine kinase
MAERRKMADAAPGPEPDLLAELRAKYFDLSRKYSALVQRLELRTSELVQHRANGSTAVYRLGFWALNATASGLSLVKDGEIASRNARWHELDVARGGWVREGKVPPTTWIDLSQAALAEAAQLPERARVAVVRRYRSVQGEQVVELRLERIDAAASPVVVLARDVSEQARAEQELSHMREALFQSEHMSILGELASSMAHELGNTLRGVTTRTNVLASDPQVMARHGPLVAGLEESIEAALESVRKLHDVARSGRLEPGPVDLRDVLRRAIEVLHLRQPPGAPAVEVRTEVPHLPLVLGTSAELSHLFVTLLFNARDAMPDGGKVHVRAERARDRVRVTVADEGTGISPEHLTHLFQPFFTTKGTAGTGLGLWLAQSALRRIGGAISARNRRSGGAEFLVELQVAGNGERIRRGRAPARRREGTARRG